jgi:hypothetical protein
MELFDAFMVLFTDDALLTLLLHGIPQHLLPINPNDRSSYNGSERHKFFAAYKHENRKRKNAGQ